MPSSLAAGVAQWDFEGDLSAATGEAALAAEAVAPAADSDVRFEDVVIGGRLARVATFSRGTVFRVPHGFAPNGGGGFLNRYTLVLDVRYPVGSSGWQCLLQTSETNADDADWCIQPDASGAGIGISGNYGGFVPDGVWHRLVLVVDLTAGSYMSFINGDEVQRNTDLALDGRFSLGETFLLFADDNAETEGGSIDVLQIYDRALCPEDVAALGGPEDGPLEAVDAPPGSCAAAPGSLRIKEGPYLQNATQEGMTVMWETTLVADSTLAYRRGEGAWIEVDDPVEVRIHEVRVEGFDSSEVVAYRVASRAGNEVVESGEYSFETAPPAPEPFSLAVWGDSQDNPSVFSRLVADMVARDVRLAVSVGDVVGTGSVYAQWGQQLLTPIQPLAREKPFFVAIGNHEQNWHWFDDYLDQPGNEHWFSFDYAGCHFVILDTNFPFLPGSEQYEWLREDLFGEAAQKSDWLMAFHHHPPFSEIYEETVYARLRTFIVPVFEAAGVDVDFTGHIHDYERGIFVPPDTGRRIAYVQTSGGGGRLWDDEFDGEWDEIEKVVQYVHHYCHLEITRERLTLTAIDLDGNAIDVFTLTALPRDGMPPPPPPPPPSGGQAATQWDFRAGDLTASYGDGALEFADGAGGTTASLTRFGTTDDFGLPSLRGEAATVMEFPRASTSAMGFRVRHGAPPNASGVYVNDYSVVADLLVPTASFLRDGWLGIHNTNASNSNDSDAFVRLADGGVGIAGQYDGRIIPDTWHRLALVFDAAGGIPQLRKYIDGALVGSQALDGVDGRWSLYSRFDGTPWFFFLTDDSGDATRGYLSSFYFVDRALSADEVEALGSSDADGIFEEPCEKDCDTLLRRGDVTQDGTINLTDVVALLDTLFLFGPLPGCLDTADTNDDGEIDVSDPVRLLFVLFVFGETPPGFNDCTLDTTDDSLTCERSTCD